MVLIVSLGSSPAWALNQAQGPAGSNFSNAHVTATGNNVDIGVIEVGTAANHGLVAGSHNVNNLSDDRWYNQAAPPLGAAPANSAGAGSTHATLVADIIGRAAGGGISGVAPDANLFVGNINASFNTHGTGQETSALRAATDWLERNNGVHLFNHSWENGQTRDAAYLDWQTQQRDTLHVLAAGNMNPNGLGDVALVYNGLTVGNLNGNRRAASSDFDAGTRSKPDLMAPGTNISNGTLNNTGTSFAAPQATGVASMLVEEGLSLGDGISGDRMAVRAIMMNSARKRGIGGTNAANASILDNAGTVSGTGDDGDYLLGGKLRPGGNTNNTAPATASWTPEQWSITGGRNLVTLSPLDDELGTGALDAVRALEQHAAGEQNEKLLNAGGVERIGWNTTFLPTTVTDAYEFNTPLSKGEFVTVTLVWERGVTETDPAAGGSAVGQVDAGDTYAYDTLADLDLRLKFQDTEVLAASLDIGSTVEHLHYPLPQDIDAFDLSIEVNWNNSSSFTNPIPYAIAWWVVPEPSALLVLVLGSLGLALIWRRWGAA